MKRTLIFGIALFGMIGFGTTAASANAALAGALAGPISDIAGKAIDKVPDTVVTSDVYASANVGTVITEASGEGAVADTSVSSINEGAWVMGDRTELITNASTVITEASGKGSTACTSLATIGGGCATKDSGGGDSGLTDLVSKGLDLLQ